jgi:hypothetical protein
MNEILKLAFKRAADVMSDAEQEAFGQWLLNALDQDERRWDKAFADPSTKLASIADEVLRDFRAERAEPFDIEKHLPHEPMRFGRSLPALFEDSRKARIRSFI